MQTTQLGLNRIFCELEELDPKDASEAQAVHFPKNDYRFDHIRTILKLNAGDNLKVGVLDVGSTDEAQIIDITDDGVHISLGEKEQWWASLRPTVDLILAVPRPLRLERILPVVSCIGVGRLVLVGASKVQADYFGSHLFRRPAEMRKGLVEGLSQGASDCLVPDVIVRRNLKKFIQSAEFDEMFDDGCQKVVAHPPSASLPLQPVRIATLPKLLVTNDEELPSQSQPQSQPQQQPQPQARIVVAVGPEGGWEDDEVQLLVSKGFQLCSLGPRILRTDMAVPVLLGLAHDWVRQEE